MCFLRTAKLENLLDTFYSLNSNKSAQSAGNLYLKSLDKRGSVSFGNGSLQGSSETICGNTYDLFRLNFLFFFKQQFNKDDIWLSWFIGFLEGDGAILEHKGRSYFVVTQKDDKVLNEIYESLKIGIVKHFYDKRGIRKYSKYIVSDNKGIFLLYLLLNGNLVLNSRINQLTKWNIALSNASRFDFCLFHTKQIPAKIEVGILPSLDNAWLSGFTDAEGCFSVKIDSSKKTNYIRLLFILDQKYEEKILNTISLLFNATTKSKLRRVNKYIESKSIINYTNSMYRLSISCNDAKKHISSNIINYFCKYPLKTSKNMSFEKWCDILKIVYNKRLLSEQDLKDIRKLRKNMNFYTIENKPIGFSKKS